MKRISLDGIGTIASIQSVIDKNTALFKAQWEEALTGADNDVEAATSVFCIGHAMTLIDYVAELIGFKNIPSIMAIAKRKEVIARLCTCPPVMAMLAVANDGKLFDPEKDELTDESEVN